MHLQALVELSFRVADSKRFLTKHPPRTNPRLPHKHKNSYPYVLRGYRTGGSYRRCLAALFEWHAETLNAWTMIAGACIAVGLLYHALNELAAADGPGSHSTHSMHSGSSWWPRISDQVPFWLLAGSTVVHAPFSVGFHLFRGMGRDVYNLWRRLDQVFIFQVGLAGWLIAIMWQWVLCLVG